METATTHQEQLNQVVINKVNAMIDRNAGNVRSAMTRLIEEGKIAQDYISPLGVDLKAAQRNPIITFAAPEGEALKMHMPDGVFTLHDNAVSQLAERMGIPSRYMRTLAAGSVWECSLAAYVLNEHTGNTKRSKVLIRAVGQEVRAVLSDSYRRLDSVKILTAFVEQAGQEGALIADAFMSDTKVWAETILPTPFVVPTAKNGNVVIFAGARFSTSDYGNGMVDMRFFMLNGACTNGMVRESIMKQVHLGSRLPESIELSQKTYELDTATQVSAVRDYTHSLYTGDYIERKAREIQGASEMEVDLDREIKNLTRDAKLLKSEGEAVQKLLMENRPDDGLQGEPTLWKLTQAITAHAREAAPERARELHEISGNLLSRVKVAA